MFCPICKIELPDGASFCSECGRPVTQTINEMQSGIINNRKNDKVSGKNAKDEISKKISALFIFCITTAIDLFCLWSVCGSEFQCFNIFLSEEMIKNSGYIINKGEVLNKGLFEFWGIVGPYFIVFSILITLASIFDMVYSYIIPLATRRFRKRKHRYDFIPIGSMELCLYIIIQFVFSMGGYFSFWLLFFTVLIIADDTARGITYNIAASAERAAKQGRRKRR